MSFTEKILKFGNAGYWFIIFGNVGNLFYNFRVSRELFSEFLKIYSQLIVYDFLVLSIEFIFVIFIFPQKLHFIMLKEFSL